MRSARRWRRRSSRCAPLEASRHAPRTCVSPGREGACSGARRAAGRGVLHMGICWLSHHANDGVGRSPPPPLFGRALRTASAPPASLARTARILGTHRPLAPSMCAPTTCVQALDSLELKSGEASTLKERVEQLVHKSEREQREIAESRASLAAACADLQLTKRDNQTLGDQASSPSDLPRRPHPHHGSSPPRIRTHTHAYARIRTHTHHTCAHASHTRITQCKHHVYASRSTTHITAAMAGRGTDARTCGCELASDLARTW